ncbi:MAG: flagellar basal body rod protein FlgB [Gammaproteobacteria bacterium]
MTISFDQALKVHASALELRSRRAEIIAANLANADTPHYQARDIDFSAMLHEAVGDDDLKPSQAGHLRLAANSSTELLYRVPTQPAIDGNTVDAEQEKAEFADNALRYQASLGFLSGRIQGLLSAIRGE